MTPRYDPDPEADEILRREAERDAAEELVFAQRGKTAWDIEKERLFAQREEERRREDRFWGTIWSMYLGREIT